MDRGEELMKCVQNTLCCSGDGGKWQINVNWALFASPK